MNTKEKPTPRHAKCPKCREVTKQTIELYNPADPNGGEVWYCHSCKQNIEWYKKGKS